MTVALACLLLCSTAQSEEREIDLRSFAEGQPMRVEDADPLQQGAQLRMLVTNGDTEGAPGLVVVPRLAVSMAQRAELELSWQGGVLEGEPLGGPFRANTQVQLLKQGPGQPGLSFSAGLSTPTVDQPLAGDAAAQLSTRVGKVGLHSNIGYRLSRVGEDNRYRVGVAADRAVSGRVLIFADAHYERFLSEARNSVQADAGAGVRLGRRTLAQSSAGFLTIGGVTEPRVLFGFMSDL